MKEKVEMLIREFIHRYQQIGDKDRNLPTILRGWLDKLVEIEIDAVSWEAILPGKKIDFLILDSHKWGTSSGVLGVNLDLVEARACIQLISASQFQAYQLELRKRKLERIHDSREN